MSQYQNSPKHSDGELPRPVPVNNNRERPLQTQTAIAPTTPTPATKAFIRRIWAPAIIVIALGLTAVWVIFLGYTLVSTIERAL
jgi:hypothetical protein